MNQEKIKELIQKLSECFAKHGRVLSRREYKRLKYRPCALNSIERYIGWGRFHALMASYSSACELYGGSYGIKECTSLIQRRFVYGSKSKLNANLFHLDRYDAFRVFLSIHKRNKNQSSVPL
jgi:hypothetical protein